MKCRLFYKIPAFSSGRKLFNIPLMYLFLGSCLFGQDTSILKAPPEEKTMVGIYGNGVVQTDNGEYIVAGWIKYQSKKFRDHDLWAIKAANSGGEIWQRRMGGKSTDRGNAIIKTIDGGVALAGITRSFGKGSYDGWLIKMNNRGEILWQKTYGDKNMNRGLALCQDSAGNLIMAGFTQNSPRTPSDGWVVKTTNEGKMIWTQKYGGSKHDRFYAVLPAQDGGFIMGGATTEGAGNLDVWVVKIDRDGNQIWEKQYGGDKEDKIQAGIIFSDGSSVFVGSTYSKGSGLEDVFCMKLDPKGEIQWEKSFGGSLSDGAMGIDIVDNREMVICGYTESKGAGYRDGWLLRLDQNGEMIWDKTFGGETTDQFNSVRLTEDGGFVISGWSKSTGYRETDIWLLKTDDMGLLEWEQVFKVNGEN